MPRLAYLAPFAVSAALACGPGSDPMSEDTGTLTGTTPPATTGEDTTDDTPTVTSEFPPGTSSGETVASDPPTTDPSTTAPSTTDVNTSTLTSDTETSATSDTGDVDSELCVHLGGHTGLSALVAFFLENVVADARINAYFLRSDLDFANLGQCVVAQLGEAVGCAGVVYSCMDMLTAHAGLGISTTDFNDFAEDFFAAWDEHKAMNAPDLTDDDLTAVIDVLTAMAPDIIEDPDDNLTVYQRVGRKPAIQAVIGDPDSPDTFIANVLADASINGFFMDAEPARLATCLVRQVHSIDGPNTYGLEIDPPLPDVDPGVTLAFPCRSMADSHIGLVDPNDGNSAIDTLDFTALVVDLVDAMTTAGVQMAEQDAIVGALAPLCTMIVAVDPENCPP